MISFERPVSDVVMSRVWLVSASVSVCEWLVQWSVSSRDCRVSESVSACEWLVQSSMKRVEWSDSVSVSDWECVVHEFGDLPRLRAQGVADVARLVLQRPGDGGRLLGQRFGELARVTGQADRGGRRDVGQSRADLLGPLRQHVGERGGLVAEVVGDAVEPRRQRLRQIPGDVDDLVGELVGLEVQRRDQPRVGGVERAAHFLAGTRELLEQVAAAIADRVDHGIAGAPERERDVLALLGERAGDALGGIIDAGRDQLAHRCDVLGEAKMHVAQRIAHLLGLVDQRLALARQVFDQAADPELVVVIGALERRHFAVHQAFELGRAGERPLDAVAHGGDFAPDRLADGHHRLAGDRVRLAEPHRHLDHRTGDQAQLLRPHHHIGDHHEEHDRQRHHHGEAEQRDAPLRQQGARIRLEEGPGRRHRDDGPADREQERDQVGGARGTLLQRLQDLADRLAVVIGGPPLRGVFDPGKRELALTELALALIAELALALVLVAEQLLVHGRGAGRPRGKVEVGRRRRLGDRRLVAMASGLGRGFPQVEGVLNRRQSRLGRILHLSRVVRHGRFASPITLHADRPSVSFAWRPRARNRFLHSARRAPRAGTECRKDF